MADMLEYDEQKYEVFSKLRVELREFAENTMGDRNMLAVDSSEVYKGFLANMEGQLADVRDEYLKNKMLGKISELKENFSKYGFNGLRNLTRAIVNQEEFNKNLDAFVKDGLDENKAKVEEFLSRKSDEELQSFAERMVKDYKRYRTDDKFAKVNTVLDFIGLEIERSKYAETTLDERRAVRAVFEGAFYIPSKRDIEKFNPYSDVFKKIEKDLGYREQRNHKEYDLKKCKAWQICKKSGLKIDDKKLAEALADIGVMPREAEKLNVSDIGKILHMQYYKTARYDESKGARVPFGRMMDSFDEAEAVRVKWWKKFASTPEVVDHVAKDLVSKGVDKDYVTFMLESMKRQGDPNPALEGNHYVEFMAKIGKKEFSGDMPLMRLHHKVGIQDAAKLGDISLVNDFSNLMAIAEFPDKRNESHEFRHLTDEPLYIKEGEMRGLGGNFYDTSKGEELWMERIVEKRDKNAKSQKSKDTVVYTSGLSGDSYLSLDVRNLGREAKLALVKNKDKQEESEESTYKTRITGPIAMKEIVKKHVLVKKK